MRKLWILLVVVASAVGIMMIGGAGTASACDPPKCPPKERGDDESGKDGDKGNACPKDNRKPPNCGNNGKPDCKKNPKPTCPKPDPCKDKCEPPAGNCEGADLEVLPGLVIVCAYQGAVTQEQLEERCPDATAVVPSPLGGLCVFLPPHQEEAAARV